MMKRKSLSVLVVEDSKDDAELLLHELTRGGYDVMGERVETADEMRAALERTSWNVVLSDYSMPTFSAPEALKVLRELHEDVPFIIVSGTIGETTAVAAMKAGAADFLVKGQLGRLIPALEREIREAESRRERKASADHAHVSKPFTPNGLVHKVRELLDLPRRCSVIGDQQTR